MGRWGGAGGLGLGLGGVYVSLNCYYTHCYCYYVLSLQRSFFIFYRQPTLAVPEPLISEARAQFNMPLSPVKAIAEAKMSPLKSKVSITGVIVAVSISRAYLSMLPYISSSDISF